MYPSTASDQGKANAARSFTDSTSAPQTRQTLSAALDQQAQDLGELHLQLDELEARIRPVCDNVPQPPGGDGSKTLETNRPLDIVVRHTGGIRAAILRVRDLTNRVHL